MIPKANGQQRGLGIPCIRDKIVQEVIRMALEPICEAEFHDNSYGFRPNRSTHHAVSRCQQMTQKGFTWVIEGDVKALCRRYDITAAQCIRKYGRGESVSIGDSYVLKRAQDIQMSWKQEPPKPYEPGTGCYLDDVDWEAEVRQYENRQRPGRMDLKAMTLFRDGNRCRKCGIRVTRETSEADHIKPVHRFASYAQATTLLNLQTLCSASPTRNKMSTYTACRHEPHSRPRRAL